MNYVCGYLFLRFKDGREFLPNKSISNINEFIHVVLLFMLNIESSVRVVYLRSE